MPTTVAAGTDKTGPATAASRPLFRGSLLSLAVTPRREEGVLPGTENEDVEDSDGEDERKSFTFALTPSCSPFRSTTGTLPDHAW
jgi:hypothetical protein